MKTKTHLSPSLIFPLVLLLVSFNLKAQTPANFSGKCEFEKTKSKLNKTDISYNGTIVLEIVQSAATISFSETYISTGNPDWKTSADTYKLDGKEYTTKSSVGTSKKTAKWAQDKKTLIITNLDIQTSEGVTSNFLVIDTYKLSDNGQTLIIEKQAKNPVTGETVSTKIYRKRPNK